jgi:hypothetical protein
MIDRIHDETGPATILLTGLASGVPYEVSIRSIDLDQLAELAARQPGRTTQLGPVRVTILSSQVLTASH